MVSSDWTRIPCTAAILIFSILSRPVASHALPRETKTIPVRTLNVADWPIVATPAPGVGSVSIGDLLQRRQFNTVCGFIGGNAAWPATCSDGSHCAVEVDHSAIGCCPNGDACTGGIFTGCVDVNSPPQTEIDPYVYTCKGANVCYKNQFDGGFFQYGCGTSSSLATTVATTALSWSPLDFSHVVVEFTATPTLLSEPTTIGSRTGTESTSTSSSSKQSTQTSSGTTSSATASDSSSTSSSTSSVESSATADPAAPSSTGGSPKNTGAIVGGVIGGLAALIGLGILAFCLLRRRKKAAAPQQYITPSTEKDQFSSHPYSQRGAGGILAGDAHYADDELAQLNHQQNQGRVRDRDTIGLAIPITRDRNRPSDEIPLQTRETPEPEPEAMPVSPMSDTYEPSGQHDGEHDMEQGPYNPRRRAGSGYLWSQTRTENRTGHRPWV